MRVVEVQVDRAAFADVLATMREWLDHHDRPLVRFDTEADGGGMITVKVQFEANDLAELFREAFRGYYSG